MALLSEIDGEQVTLHPNDREAFRNAVKSAVEAGVKIRTVTVPSGIGARLSKKDAETIGVVKKPRRKKSVGSTPKTNVKTDTGDDAGTEDKEK